MQSDDGRIVSNLIVQAIEQRPLTIYGTGDQTRSLCYVSDLVRGLISLMNVKPNPGVPVNLGNPGEFTIRELAEVVLALVPTKSTIVHKPLPIDDPQRRRPDIERARALLDWHPRVSLSDGLPKTVAWFQKSLPEGRHSAGGYVATVAASRSSI